MAFHLEILARRDAIAYQSHSPSEKYRERDRKAEPAHSDITRRRNDNPPRIPPQARSARELFVNIADFPQPVDSRVYQSHGGSVDASEARFDPAMSPECFPESHRAVYEDQTRCEDGDETNDSAGCAGVRGINGGQRT